MVPQETIDQVRQAINLVDLVGDSVSLRKVGRNHVGLCPFHPEKSPSFSVHGEKNLFHCFGCQAGGDAFAFVMRQQGLDFHGALTLLGRRVGVEVEPLSPHQQRQRQAEERLAAVNACAQRFFSLALLHPCGAPARAALTERGAPAAQVKARALGYGHTTAAFLAYLKKAGHEAAQAQAAGLLNDAGDRLLFERRLIFPIFALGGTVVGFGGRRLQDDGHGPKYINSKESALFAKGRLLYGLHEAHAAIRSRRLVTVMEGYTDVLTAARSGIDTAVAVLGTAFTLEHAKSLQRLCDGVVICLDADRAGRSAAFKSSQVALQAGLQARIADLPAGEDPDSLVRRSGPAALQRCLQAARPAMEFFLDAWLPAATAMGIEQRAQAARALQPLLQALGTGLERDLYTERMAQRVGVSVPQLQRALQTRAAPASRRSRGAGPAADGSDGPPRRRTDAGEAAKKRALSAPTAAAGAPTAAVQPAPPHAFELELLRELLLFPSLRARFGEMADYAVSETMRLLLEDLASSSAPWQEVLPRYVRAGPTLTKLLRVQPKAAMESTKKRPADDLGGDEVASGHTFSAVLASLKCHRLDVALRELVQEIRQCEATGEATVRLMRRKQELTARKRALKQDALPRSTALPTPLAATENVQGE